MKVKRQYVEILRFLAGGESVYDSTLIQYVPEHKITSDGRVVAVYGNVDIDLLPIFPTAKVANKITEFILKNAALSLCGVWQGDDDGVINLKNISLIPGAITKKAVGSDGLTPLYSQRPFNLSWNMVESLQRQIREYFNSRTTDINKKQSKEV